MKRLIVAIVAALALAPAAALALTPTAAHRHQYERLYHQAAQKFGKRAPGRNIDRWGLAPSGRKASDADLARSIAVLKRMVAPAPAPAPAAAPTAAPGMLTVPTAPPATPVASGGAGGVPACASESGTNYSTGPDNTNASSGATGRYQVTPGTAAAYGCDLSTPAGQDACAAAIYAKQGASAWVGCGG